MWRVDLNAGRTPRNELSQLTIANGLQTFVDFPRTDLSLENIENRYITALAHVGCSHNVFGIQKAFHDVQD
jgi:hypothetical protein